jgi:hypothetical protein
VTCQAFFTIPAVSWQERLVRRLPLFLSQFDKAGFIQDKQNYSYQNNRGVREYNDSTFEEIKNVETSFLKCIEP